jgi:hypothetical protein
MTGLVRDWTTGEGAAIGALATEIEMAGVVVLPVTKTSGTGTGTRFRGKGCSFGSASAATAGVVARAETSEGSGVVTMG